METIQYQSDFNENQTWEKTEGKDYAIVTGVTIMTVCLAALATPAIFHWYLVPVVLCGILIGADGVAWFRGNMDAFDVKGLIGAAGYHYFYIAPLIFVVFRGELRYLDNPTDWRPWLGKMALLNLMGLILYKFIQERSQRGVNLRQKVWMIATGRMNIILCVAVIVSLSSQIFLFVVMGGFRGLAEAYTEDTSSLYRLGSFRIMGSGLPILVLIAITVLFRRPESKKASWFEIILILSVLSGLHILGTGVSTDRGLIISAIIWMVMIIHYFWRPLSPRTLILMVLPLIPMMWIYSFYKTLGIEAVRGGSVSSLSAETGHGLIGALIGDMSRVDIQPYLIYMQENYPGSYDLRYGLTYLESIYPIIPYWIWSGKPAHSGKVIAGTEALYGKGYYDRYSSFSRTNHAFGIAGEAILNFGMVGVPVAYAVMGFLVGRFRRYMRGIPPGDPRLFILPYAIWFLVNLLLWDSDNYLAHFMMRGSFSVLICFLIVKRVPVDLPDEECSQYLQKSALEYP